MKILAENIKQKENTVVRVISDENFEKCNENLKFPILKVTDLDASFGRQDGVYKIMPEILKIPEEFEFMSDNKWNNIFTRWWEEGFQKGTIVIPKEGVDVSCALRHLVAIIRSFEPQHQDKESAIAFLLSEWFDDIIFPKERNERIKILDSLMLR